MIMISSPATSMTHPLPLSFPVWLAAARCGESEGYSGLYSWLGGPVTRFAMGRGAADPEAITNDTFVAAFRTLENFDGDAAAFRAWVFTIARNRLIDAHRATARRPQITDGPVPEGESAGSDPATISLDGADRVARLLTSLTEAQREVILRIIADLSLAETAEIVSRPVTAIKRLQARALTRLRQAVLDEEVSP